MRGAGRRILAILAVSVVLLWLFLIISADARQDDDPLSDFAATSVPSLTGGSESSFGGTSDLDLIFDAFDGGF